MRKNKLANKRISVETLLDIIDETPLDRAKRTDVYQFVKDFNIEEGTDRVPNSIIYYLYLKTDKYDKLTRKMFFNQFCQFFEQYKTPVTRGYCLKHNLTWTEEDMIQARIMIRKEQYEKDITKRARKTKKKEVIES